MTRLFTFLAFFAFLSLSAQKTYLKITQNEQSTFYPPGTQFELKNPNGYIVLKYSETPREEHIDGNYQLIVSPTWKKEKDIFKLTLGDKVELVRTGSFSLGKEYKKGVFPLSSVKAEKTITDSQTLASKKNLRLTLDNGLLFVYEDGNYYAKLDSEYIDIQNKYVIKTQKGILRVSFNPDNGVTWWFFGE